MEQTYTATVKRINTTTTARIFVSAELPGWPQGRAFVVKLDRIRDQHGRRQHVVVGDPLKVVIDSARPEKIARAERLEPTPPGSSRTQQNTPPRLEYTAPLLVAEA